MNSSNYSRSLSDHGYYNSLGRDATLRANGHIVVSNGAARSTSPYPRDNVRDSYTRKYEERISTNKSDEGLYPP